MARAARASRTTDTLQGASVGGWMLAVLIALCILLTTGAFLLDRAARGFEGSVRQQQAVALASHVNTTDRAIDLWFATQERFVAKIAAKPGLVRLTRRLLEEDPRPEVLAASPVLAEIRAVLQEEIDVVDGRGIFILGTGNVNFASLRDANLGVENFLVHEHPLQIRDAWAGGIVAIPPVRSDVPLGGVVDPESDRSLFLAAPLRDAAGAVLAVLTVRYDARQTIDRILTDAELDDDLDVYAFDENARFVTKPGHTPVTSAAPHDPTQGLWFLDARVAVADADAVGAGAGAVHRPTHLVRRAIHRGRGMDAAGYEGYAGDRVIGAWAWNTRLNLGLAAEVNEARALAMAGRVKGHIRLLAVVVTCLSLVLVISSLVHRRIHRRHAAALRNDALSGVACRGYFDARLARDVATARRSRLPLSLILLDIDDFKRFNDTHGHPAGDACIRAIAACLERSCDRPTDLVARYGGEEFALILPMTDAAGAARVAAKVQQAIGDRRVPHEASRVSNIVTVSIGVFTARIPDDAAGPQELVQSADRNLYRAKDLGRNRVVASGPGAARDAADDDPVADAPFAADAPPAADPRRARAA